MVGTGLEDEGELLEQAWRNLEESPSARFEPREVNEFLDRMASGIAYWQQRGHEDRAAACRSAVQWARERLARLTRGEWPWTDEASSAES
jgi:hypothetical protein